MKNQYVGDVNDYVKYAFLRRLIRAGSEIDVCWMLTSDDGRNDGNRRAYLNKPELLRSHDPDLFDALSGALREARDVSLIAQSGILASARFFSDMLEDGSEARAAYFGRLEAMLRPNSLVFLDPDNGLDVATVQRGRRNSSKYLYRDELRALLTAGHSAVVYQHFPRVERLAFLSTTLSTAVSIPRLTRASVSTTHVAYLLFLQEPHLGVRDSARAFAEEWHPPLRYFELTD